MLQKWKDKFWTVVWYLSDRLMEPSGIRGLIMMSSGGGWKALDGSSRGEQLAQWGMILMGAIQLLLPQRTLYGTSKSQHTGS